MARRRRAGEATTEIAINFPSLIFFVCFFFIYLFVIVIHNMNLLLVHVDVFPAHLIPFIFFAHRECPVGRQS